jgi:hypothetical protein
MPIIELPRVTKDGKKPPDFVEKLILFSSFESLLGKLAGTMYW